jgi:cysteine desulfurase
MITQREIYLDCNATHPLLSSVREGLSQALTTQDPRLGNPSSIHRRGQKAKAAMASLRDSLCRLLGRGDGDEFVFTSGATEAINLAMRGFRDERSSVGRRTRILASSLEHSAVLDTMADLRGDYGFVPVSREGELDEKLLDMQIQEALDQEADLLLCFQICNNETGIVLNLPEVLARLHSQFAPKPLLHLPRLKAGRYPMSPQRVWVLLDGAQALGKLDESHIRRALHYADYLALSAHKIGGPAGVGALWLRQGSPFKSQITGGVQERRRRAGTHNSLGLFGFHLALEDWIKNGEVYRARMSQLRELLARELKKIPGLEIHGLGRKGELPGLCNTLNFHVEACPEESLLLALDLDGFCVSSGSACNSGSLKPSHVLLALGYSSEVSLSSIRVSLGAESSEDDVKAFAASVAAKVKQVREARVRSQELFGDEQNTAPDAL